MPVFVYTLKSGASNPDTFYISRGSDWTLIMEGAPYRVRAVTDKAAIDSSQTKKFYYKTALGSVKVLLTTFSNTTAFVLFKADGMVKVSNRTQFGTEGNATYIDGYNLLTVSIAVAYAKKELQWCHCKHALLPTLV